MSSLMSANPTRGQALRARAHMPWKYRCNNCFLRVVYSGVTPDSEVITVEQMDFVHTNDKTQNWTRYRLLIEGELKLTHKKLSVVVGLGSQLAGGVR
jgi:hypothetical protein